MPKPNFRLDLAIGGLNFQLDAPGRDGFRLSVFRFRESECELRISPSRRVAVSLSRVLPFPAISLVPARFGRPLPAMLALSALMAFLSIPCRQKTLYQLR
jgi:hypothetical protein